MNITPHIPNIFNLVQHLQNSNLIWRNYILLSLGMKLQLSLDLFLFFFYQKNDKIDGL